ncbi:hypothetical protein B0H13DRAFT_2682765 [Mycena leptocephala]|nr:hypothetical protein B0H13DRAFT_2682765 [Mycena leptocephala]
MGTQDGEWRERVGKARIGSEVRGGRRVVHPLPARRVRGVLVTGEESGGKAGGGTCRWKTGVRLDACAGIFRAVPGLSLWRVPTHLTLTSPALLPSSLQAPVHHLHIFQPVLPGGAPSPTSPASLWDSSVHVHSCYAASEFGGGAASLSFFGLCLFAYDLRYFRPYPHVVLWQ